MPATRLPFVAFMPGRPGEVHPEPLTDPCVNLSISRFSRSVQEAG